MGGPRVERVLDDARLAALAPAWAALWDRDPGATPFAHPAWLLPWRRTFADGDLLSLAAFEGDRLVGLLPLYVLPDPAGGGAKLLPLGIGITDALDPLLEPGLEGPVLDAAFAALAAPAGRPLFDRLDWPCLGRAAGPLATAARAAGWAARAGPDAEPCPWLPLPGTVEALHAALPRSRAGKMPYYRRRLDRLGEVRFETAGTADRALAFLDALFELHARRWGARGEPGVLADARVRAFHRLAAPGLLAAGLLRLRALLLDGRPVAVVLGLADRTRAHAYIGGWDADLPHPGLGAFAIGLCLEAAVAEGAREFHFLRGREPYKYAWGAVDRPAYALSARPRHLEQEGEPVPAPQPALAGG